MDRRGGLSLHGRLKHPRYIAPFPSAFPKNGNNGIILLKGKENE
jgi:hypothetical protein